MPRTPAPPKLPLRRTTETDTGGPLFEFDIQATEGAARAGRLTLPHGEVQTPVFMPVGTQATVKTLTPEEVQGLGAQIILGNTYHLYLRPGHETVRQMGGLHRFQGWHRPILTDSGGFQVFSLSDINVIEEEGVTFQSHIDGSRHLFTPERVMGIERALGADIIMAFDQCPPGQSSREVATEAYQRTLRWLERCRTRFAELPEEDPDGPEQTLFPIVQGGIYPDLRDRLRARHAGRRGLARHRHRRPVGGRAQADHARHAGGAGAGAAHAAAALPDGRGLPGRPAGGHRPRHGHVRLRGAHAKRAQRRRVDHGRGAGEHQAAPLSHGRGAAGPGVRLLHLPHYTRAYLRHLFVAGEGLSLRLLSIHNLHFLVNLARQAREHIQAGDYASWSRAWLDRFHAGKAARG